MIGNTFGKKYSAVLMRALLLVDKTRNGLEEKMFEQYPESAQSEVD